MQDCCNCKLKDQVSSKTMPDVMRKNGEYYKAPGWSKCSVYKRSVENAQGARRNAVKVAGDCGKAVRSTN